MMANVQQMPLFSAYPGPLSVLVMDNAHIHHGDEILELADRFSEFIQAIHGVIFADVHLKQGTIGQLSKAFDRFPDKWIIFAAFM